MLDKKTQQIKYYRLYFKKSPRYSILPIDYALYIVCARIAYIKIC